MCRHCGDPCGDDAVSTADGHFCCHGCASVYSLLQLHGLTQFYACDSDAGLSQRATARRAADRFAPLDDPDIAARFIDAHDGTFAHATFSVPALHCASCLWLLERLWRFDEGIGRSEADLVRRTVRVAFRQERTSLRAVAERLASLGYEPVVDGERVAGRMPAARRTLYLKIGIAAFAVGNMMLFSIPRYANGAPLEPVFQRLFDALNVLLAVPVLVYSASDFFTSAWHALRMRAVTLDVPIAIGLSALVGRSVWDIATGTGEGFLDSFAGLVLFLLIGRLFQQIAFDRIAFDRTLRSFLPLSVRLVSGATTVMRRIEALVPGDVIAVRPCEVIPADARMLDAAGRLDLAFVTGEQRPVAIAKGDAVPAGGRVVGEGIRVEVVRPVSHSRLAELWNNPVFAHRQPHWLTEVSARFGGWFTVIAVALAAIGFVAWLPDVGAATQVATAVLIIACPCALTLAAPITLGTALGRLGIAGVYLKQPAVALDLSRIDTVVFDKTGTLTSAESAAVVQRHGLDSGDWERVRRLAAESIHPASRALVGDEPTTGVVHDVVESAGAGISGTVDDACVAIGSAHYVGGFVGVSLPVERDRTWVSVGGDVGWFTLATRERPGATTMVRDVADAHETWLLSGDADAEAARWRHVFGARVRFRQSPEDKLASVQARQRDGRRVLMVGDGLNDAGALAAADVGVAVSDETACLVPACDVVMRGDRLTLLPAVLRYARRARAVIVLCFAVSILYNIVGIGFALTGHLTPLATAILMPVSSLTIVGLSVGLMRVRVPGEATPCP
ncbi:MAG: heavy metal translocating P-type ATPase metal-binding domain-containing protein [Acidobacteria bacterium]|nr:heavy metal translocating P-type ATPase metal-binding domain-containing protein [Acidobacteriota bacterium]